MPAAWRPRLKAAGIKCAKSPINRKASAGTLAATGRRYNGMAALAARLSLDREALAS